MIKGILLSIILLACVAAGRVLSNARKKRCETITEILAAMRVLRLRMLNSMEPIGILLRKSDCRLFCELGNSLWEGAGLTEAWKNMRNGEGSRSCRLDSLTEDDLKILDTFFSGLGGSGREEQCELFSSVISDLEEQHGMARDKYRYASKLYTALGALLGIGICIMIV